MTTCERCEQPAERAETEREQWFCPRCGVWLHADGAEIGPPISHEQAQVNCEQFTIDTAAQIIRETERQRLKADPGNFASVTIKKIQPVSQTSQCTDCSSTDGSIRWYFIDGSVCCPECWNKRYPLPQASGS